jgi:hypothetical protein
MKERTKLLLILAVFATMPSQVRAQTPPEKPNSQDEIWSHLKDMRAGPVTFDLGGQARLRYEYGDGFTIKGYEPGGHDQLLLERVRLDLAARFWDRPRLFLQLQDVHPFLTKLGQADFPTSSPIEDTLDIRQLYAEWLKIGDSPFGFRIGRQQIAYGDQRVFGPGNWGNTGRFAWDAAMLKRYLNLFFWANLRDAELDFSVKPWRGLTLYVEYHHFNLDQAKDAWYTTGLKAYRRDPTGGSGTTLGDELDARVVWSLWNHLELMAGYGRFFPGGFVRATGASAPANWYFAQAAYSWLKERA